jgi:hypothetical protein
MEFSTSIDGSRLWTRYRTRGMDGRTRAARRWKALHADLLSEFTRAKGREPTDAERHLLDGATDCALMVEAARTRIAASEAELTRLGGGLRRAMMMLGMAARVAAPEHEPEPEQSLADLLREHGKP